MESAHVFAGAPIARSDHRVVNLYSTSLLRGKIFEQERGVRHFIQLSTGSFGVRTYAIYSRGVSSNFFLSSFVFNNGLLTVPSIFNVYGY